MKNKTKINLASLAAFITIFIIIIKGGPDPWTFLPVIMYTCLIIIRFSSRPIPKLRVGNIYKVLYIVPYTDIVTLGYINKNKNDDMEVETYKDMPGTDKLEKDQVYVAVRGSNSIVLKKMPQ